jgi:23S rRNA (cytosine1962-C5)-methyltransferase
MDQFPKDRYQLVDFGNARKLESLGGYLVDRPSPAAINARPADPGLWKHASARFDQHHKRWTLHQPWPDPLVLDCGGFRMPLRPTPFGHIGLFPEQSANWRWLRNVPRSDNAGSADTGDASKFNLPALNLFGYTGASTMALVSAGFAVAHVDAAKPNVDAARRAARLNGWSDKPIRYLVDDAAKFAARELRRGRTYHTIVLDPPAYGHSPKQSRSGGKAWRLERDLWPLLDDCIQLLDFSNSIGPRILLTGHTESIGPAEVIQYLRRCLDQADIKIESSRSRLTTPTGRSLDAGFQVRCVCAPKTASQKVD